MPGVEPDAGVARYQGIVRKAFVEPSIRDHQRIVMEDGVGAERYAAGGLIHVKSDT